MQHEATKLEIPMTPLVQLALSSGWVELVGGRGRWPDVVVRFPENAHAPTGWPTGSKDAVLRTLSAIGAGLMLAALMPNEREQLGVELWSPPASGSADECGGDSCDGGAA